FFRYPIILTAAPLPYLNATPVLSWYVPFIEAFVGTCQSSAVLSLRLISPLSQRLVRDGHVRARKIAVWTRKESCASSVTVHGRCSNFGRVATTGRRSPQYSTPPMGPL